MHRLLAAVVGILLGAAPHASAQQGTVPASLDDMVRRIFGTAEFRSKDRMAPGTWIEGGAAWLQLDPAPGGSEVIRIVTASGGRSTLASVADLTPKGASQPINPEQVVLSTDGRYLLIYTASAKVWRANTRGDYWVLELHTKRLRQLGGSAPPSSLMYATFAPTNDRMAYARGGDLYVERIADGTVTRLTTGGDSLHLNGTTDWAYEEEFGLRQAFAWSPDGARIAYLNLDMTGVPRQTLIDDLSARYPVTFSFPYPKVGETLPSVRLGVVSAGGGVTTWAKLEANARASYLPRFLWSDNHTVLVERLNRRQDSLAVIAVRSNDGMARQVLMESDAAWVDVVDEITVLPGGAFLWLSDRGGWRQLYRVRIQDGAIVTLTSPSWDVLAIEGVDTLGGTAYVSGAGAGGTNATQRALYQVSLKGIADMVPSGVTGQAGTHIYRISSDLSACLRYLLACRPATATGPGHSSGRDGAPLPRRQHGPACSGGSGDPAAARVPAR